MQEDEDMMYEEPLPNFQVQFSSDENPRMLRQLDSNLVNKMVVIPGIITAASKSNIKATKITVKCRNCGHQKTIQLKAGFSGAVIPRVCDNKLNPGPDKDKCP